MSDAREVIDQTEKRLAEVEALLQTMHGTVQELTAYGDLLRQKIATLRGQEAPAAVPLVPEPPAPAARAPETPAPAPAARVPAPPARPSPPAAPARPAVKPVTRSGFALPEPPRSAPGADVRRARPTMDINLDEEAAVGNEPAAEEEDDESKFADRRAQPRRKGNPVSVQVSNSGATTEPMQGWVVDRSTGGLRLLVDQEIKPGTVLSVRPSKSHPGFTWVQIKVKSCRPERSSYNLGCQFMRKLTWTELQVFG